MADDDSRIEKKKKERETNYGDETSWTPYIILGIIILIIVAVSYTFFLSEGEVQVAEEMDGVKALEGAENPTLVAENVTENDTDEMVEVVYYGDYGCPFCARFEQTQFERFKEDYIETGKVVYRYRVVDFIDPTNSPQTALADRAVWNLEPEDYWRWHRTTYQNHGGEGIRWASNDRMRRWTEEAGINASSEVMQSVTSGEYQNEIEQNKRAYESAGARGTPTFVVDGTVLNPLNEYSRVETIINETIEEKRE